ncbi:MAG: homocysteine S-methyltransferase family protein [Planctomycetaceae bacterium]|jgi:methionine synthase I (cobalamin-dependent)|nr:homocysteine S-methyltransferase family protein [Planctomycetaceae bacterium]
MTIDSKNNVTENNSDWYKSGIFLLDGGWGTQLQSCGLAVGEQPDLWNLSHSEAVLSVAQAYVSAGSDVILTNTFGGSRFVLARNGSEDKVEAINRAGVAISKQAAGGKAKVVASVGPSGMMLISGNVTEQELYDSFLEQVSAIAAEKPDGIVVETMSDPAEAVIAVKAAKTTGLPVAACMVFDSGKNKDRTMMGTTPEQAVAKLTEAGADIIGSNCGQGVDGFIPICERLRAATSLPIWIKANAGLPKVVDGQTIYSQSPDEFAQKAEQLIAAGANFIGGCCGTTPDFIAKLRQTVFNIPKPVRQ